jgi:hypothetical protein
LLVSYEVQAASFICGFKDIKLKVVVVVVVVVVEEVSLLLCPHAQQLEAGFLCNKVTTLFRDTTKGTPLTAAAVLH